eukprot:CAMPEP_0172315142 /NCGR_PEP_ID=MMETSP1058-20130122/24199_1 /TAXON_ID=83371 /ORGANISM="Detonula confervacea, Strain CCMP 353" /LENGTH=686 /DNA_ID=CAMNT_0013029155 /DNA_START=30 /DNA_END=2090 /DNA_ORIENTATION=+
MDTFGNDLSSGGQVLSAQELINKRRRSGQCPTCGQKCFKKKLFKLEPLTTTGKILNGRCLVCNPQDPNKEELVASCAVTRAPSSSSSSSGRRKKGEARSKLAASATKIGSNLRASKQRGQRLKAMAPTRHSSMGEIGIDESDEDDDLPSQSISDSTSHRSHRQTDPGEGRGGGEKPFNRRDSLTRHQSGSFRADSFIQRQTPRPSAIFLDGINIEDLFNDDYDMDTNITIGNSSETNNRLSESATAARRLSMDERHGLQSLNSDRNSFLDIVNIMMVNSISAAVQNEGLHALSLVHDPDVKLLRECACICGFEVIVSAMGKCGQDAMAQTNACKVLFIASASGEDLQMAIGNAGGFEALVDAMKEFESDVIVVEGCLLALSNLCIPEENILSYALPGELIELTVNAMSQNVENCGLQEHGCAILANLAMHDDARGRIRDCGGCDTVVVSMVVNPMDGGVQQQALVALRNLCVQDDENKVLLANAGAIDVVIQAMLNHRDDVQIQFRGSWVLGIIGVNEDNKLYIGENGGVDVIVRSMFVYPNDLGIQEKACRALWTLSVNHQNRYSIVKAEAIPAIVVAMQKHASVPEIQERGCGVLCNLVANDDNIKIQIVDEGALDVIVMAMVLHGENEKIQERAVALLYKLCIPENVSRMINANVSPMMAVVAETFPDCEEKASYVLTQLEES